MNGRMEAPSVCALVTSVQAVADRGRGYIGRSAGIRGGGGRSTVTGRELPEGNSC